MRDWHEEEALARELARKHYEPLWEGAKRKSPPPSVVDWVEKCLDRRFRDEQTYGHFRGKNIAFHHDSICARCWERGWSTTSPSGDEIIVFTTPSTSA